jgi:hypothetical protein
MRDVTNDMLALLPSWMKIRQDPESTQGGQFLETIGEQAEDILRLLEGVLILRNPAIDPYTQPDDYDQPILRVTGVDLYRIDYVPRLELPAVLASTAELDVTGDGLILRRCTSVFDFYRQDDLDKYYYDEDDRHLYFRQAYDQLLVAGIRFDTLESYHIWGPYDEAGLLLNCPRLPSEVNADYRLRLVDVFRNPPGATRQGLTNHISRGLGLTADQVRLIEFTDERVAQLCESVTLAPELWEFLDLAAQVHSATGSSYWEIIDGYSKGVRYLPLAWNADLDDWTDEQIQDGIGYGDDLLVTAPQQLLAEQEFQYEVGVEGITLVPADHYPDIEFQYKVEATGLTYADSNDGVSPEDYGLTILSAPLVPIEFEIDLDKDYLHADTQSSLTAYHPTGWDTVADYDPLVPGDIPPAPDPLNVRKESAVNGEFTWLEVCIPVRDQRRNTDHTVRPESADTVIGFNQVTVDYTDMTDAKKQLVFTNFEMGASDYVKETGGTVPKIFIPIDQAVLEANADNVYVDKFDTNIQYQAKAAAGTAPNQDAGQTKANGAYLAQADSLTSYRYREDWLACDETNTLGLIFNTDGSISIG